jgi:Tol biopolymer transport system component
VSISPDGRFAAIDIDGANANIWVLEFSRSTLTRLTLEWSNNLPFWAANGARIAFSSARAGVRSLFWQPTEGHADMEPLTPDRPARNGSFSPDGRTLAFAGPSPETGWDVWVMPMDGKRQARPFAQTRFNEGSPRFSPDGRWLAYVSDETGRAEVYAQPFPGPGRRVRISADGGAVPIWSRDGRELFYQRGGPASTSIGTGPAAGTDVMAVRVIADAGDLSPQRPELLFRKIAKSAYDIAPDGRFLMAEPVEATAASAPIAVVLNWLEELKQRVPAR